MLLHFFLLAALPEVTGPLQVCLVIVGVSVDHFLHDPVGFGRFLLIEIEIGKLHIAWQVARRMVGGLMVVADGPVRLVLPGETKGIELLQLPVVSIGPAQEQEQMVTGVVVTAEGDGDLDEPAAQLLVVRLLAQDTFVDVEDFLIIAVGRGLHLEHARQRDARLVVMGRVAEVKPVVARCLIVAVLFFSPLRIMEKHAGVTMGLDGVHGINCQAKNHQTGEQAAQKLDIDGSAVLHGRSFSHSRGKKERVLSAVLADAPRYPVSQDPPSVRDNSSYAGLSSG